MIDIGINKMTKAYFSNELFSEIDLEVKSRERIALLGDNGVGKTTLFKIITEEEPYNSGDFFKRKGLKIGYLNQIPPMYKTKKVKDVLMEAFSDLIEIQLKLSDLESKMKSDSENLEKILEEFGNLQSEYEINGGYKIEEKLSKITKGMKIDENIQGKPYQVLSGGEKTRVILAKLLLEQPDTLLLDEPTNHLDIEMTEWLESYLKTYEGSVLIISHDRYFLDQVIDKIYEIKAKKVEVYHGNYSYYLKERQLRYEQALRKFNAQKRKMKQMEKAADRMRDWANRGDNEAMYVRAKAMERRIEKMNTIDRPVIDKNNIEIGFDFNKRSGKEVVRLKNYNLKVANQLLARNIDFTLFYGEKAALIGNNGTGKSTLIKEILKASIEELNGININPSVKVGYLEQDIKFNENHSILDYFKTKHPDNDGAIRNYLSKFKFINDDVFNKVSSLSGGEKVRIKLASLMKQEINFLILDEPTNHIDIKTRKVLEDALETFKGTILFISHDRYFLNKFANRIIELKEKTLNCYFGDYEYYKRKKKDINKNKEENKNENINKTKKVKKERKNKKKVDPYKIKRYEEEIEKIEKAIDSKQEFISKNPSAYEEIEKVLITIEKLENTLEDCLEAYYGYLEEFDNN